jgi:hypothetical protein
LSLVTVEHSSGSKLELRWTYLKIYVLDSRHDGGELTAAMQLIGTAFQFHSGEETSCDMVFGW